MQGEAMLLGGCLLAMPKPAPGSRAGSAKMLPEQWLQAEPDPLQAQPHCAARNHPGGS